MMDKNPEAVGKVLEKIVKNEPAEELIYDPESNMLAVIREDDQTDDPDRVPATYMAREGFFYD